MIKKSHHSINFAYVFSVMGLFLLLDLIVWIVNIGTMILVFEPHRYIYLYSFWLGGMISLMESPLFLFILLFAVRERR
jgi:hypothetical protein